MFTLTAAQLHAAATSITASTAGDDYLPMLNYARIRASADGIVFLSSDRFTIHEYTAKQPEPEPFGRGTAYVHAIDMARLAHLLAPAEARQDDGAVVRCTAPTVGTLEWRTADMMISTFWEPRHFEEYPDLQELLEPAPETKWRSTGEFQAARLENTLRAAAVAGSVEGDGGSARVELMHSGGGARAHIKATGFRGIVSGLRDGAA